MMLSFTLLMISFCGQYLAFGAFIDFQLTTSNPNRLTLECISSVTGDVDSDANILFFSSPSASPTGNIFSGGTFNITPINEGFFRCTSIMDQSDFVAIAGKDCSACSCQFPEIGSGW